MSRRKKPGNGRISVHTPDTIEDILCESADYESHKVLDDSSLEASTLLLLFTYNELIQGT